MGTVVSLNRSRKRLARRTNDDQSTFLVKYGKDFFFDYLYDLRIKSVADLYPDDLGSLKRAINRRVDRICVLHNNIKSIKRTDSFLRNSPQTKHKFDYQIILKKDKYTSNEPSRGVVAEQFDLVIKNTAFNVVSEENLEFIIQSTSPNGHIIYEFKARSLSCNVTLTEDVESMGEYIWVKNYFQSCGCELLFESRKSCGNTHEKACFIFKKGDEWGLGGAVI